MIVLRLFIQTVLWLAVMALVLFLAAGNPAWPAAWAFLIEIGVLGLAVAPEARRRGVATALLAAAEQRARARGARKLSLRTFSTNPEAIQLYSRLGFEREGLLRAEFLIEGQYVDDILLAKDLTGPAANGAAG